MSDLNKFRCPECNKSLERASDFTIAPFDNSEVEIQLECCDIVYSTFIEATEFYIVD
jgi:hypothetical protein